MLADPGNVIIMKDGRLGLIDYGMVGRLGMEERELVASTVMAFQEGEDETVVRNYRDSGYLAEWTQGGDHDDIVYKRFATFHPDRVNLAPIKLENGDVYPILDRQMKSIERCTPDWIEQMKRRGELMMGVAPQQPNRPILLLREKERATASGTTVVDGGEIRNERCLSVLPAELLVAQSVD